ncbi:MAG TPA: hypothetical protein VF456_26200 [Vicinamibacterales bacterium]
MRTEMRAALAMLLATLISAGTACSKTSNPSAPDPDRSPYIGKWTGTVTSELIGRGIATIVFDGGFKTPSVIQVTGHWNFEFSDQRFSATGTVSGSALTNADLFVLAFSSATVPCPAANDGTDVKGRSASVTVTGNRMQGTYIANGCPGGTIDLTRD